MFEFPIRTGGGRYDSVWRRGAFHGFIAGSVAYVVMTLVVVSISSIGVFLDLGRYFSSPAFFLAVIAYTVSIVVFGWVLGKLTDDVSIFKSSLLFPLTSLVPSAILVYMVSPSSSAGAILFLVVFGIPFVVLPSAFVATLPVETGRGKITLVMYVVVGGFFGGGTVGNILVSILEGVVREIQVLTAAGMFVWLYVITVILLGSYSVGYEVVKEKGGGAN